MEHTAMNTQKFKIVIDILLTAALLLLMPYELVGEAAHEWIGAGMFVILIIHHILNRRWTSHTGKGKYTPIRIIQTVLVCLLVICILGSMVSGILLSRHIFSFVNITGVSATAGIVHMTCAYWGFVLMSLHLGIHWRVIMSAAGKQFSKPNQRKDGHMRTRILGILGTATAIYGGYAFVKRNIEGYLFLQTHFVFFDYSEPVVFYIIDYMTTMGLLIFLGYYMEKGLQSIYRKVHTR